MRCERRNITGRFPQNLEKREIEDSQSSPLPTLPVGPRCPAPPPAARSPWPAGAKLTEAALQTSPAPSSSDLLHPHPPAEHYLPLDGLQSRFLQLGNFQPNEEGAVCRSLLFPPGGWGTLKQSQASLARSCSFPLAPAARIPT